MIKEFLVLLLGIVVIQATSIPMPDYYTTTKTCYGYQCPSYTMNCKKHAQSEGDYRVHINVFCQDQYGNILSTHTHHVRNRRPGSRFHVDTYELPVSSGCSDCDYNTYSSEI